MSNDFLLDTEKEPQKAQALIATEMGLKESQQKTHYGYHTYRATWSEGEQVLISIPKCVKRETKRKWSRLRGEQKRCWDFLLTLTSVFFMKKPEWSEKYTLKGHLKEKQNKGASFLRS